MSDRLEHLPFARLLDIRITDAGEGRAVGRIDLQEKHTSNPASGIAHGGVPYALADTVAGAAAGSVNASVTPTIDMRIDYLQPSVGEYIEAEAEVVRNGNSVSTVDVEVRDDAGDLVATARGTFKSSGSTGTSPWEADRDGGEP
ncbi:MAG: PaaI family thioesterase [Haloarculaceae archaeon]